MDDRKKFPVSLRNKRQGRDACPILSEKQHSTMSCRSLNESEVFSEKQREVWCICDFRSSKVCFFRMTKLSWSLTEQSNHSLTRDMLVSGGDFTGIRHLSCIIQQAEILLELHKETLALTNTWYEERFKLSLCISWLRQLLLSDDRCAHKKYTRCFSSRERNHSPHTWYHNLFLVSTCVITYRIPS